MKQISEHLTQILDTLPTRPGCYIYKNTGGEIIYVGKAINLRNRVRSYFHDSQLDFKTRQLVKNIVNIDWIVVESELEALILEMNLIKNTGRATTSASKMINAIRTSKSIGQLRSPR